jgi:hypothetical protein
VEAEMLVDETGWRGEPVAEHSAARRRRCFILAVGLAGDVEPVGGPRDGRSRSSDRGAVGRPGEARHKRSTARGSRPAVSANDVQAYVRASSRAGVPGRADRRDRPPRARAFARVGGRDRSPGTSKHRFKDAYTPGRGENAPETTTR